MVNLLRILHRKTPYRRDLRKYRLWSFSHWQSLSLHGTHSSANAFPSDTYQIYLHIVLSAILCVEAETRASASPDLPPNNTSLGLSIYAIIPIPNN